ncbi:hypothetical protein [Hymenobacter pini]|uniref:hypothetical protein n=1 Tax=Hymenobacter pini TaxID=2880879 RepID=UPI001CF2274E|nr:hypothetical protein [Hymenobacter pini]MCA8833383.1 hypothetical protein [Hymenobacter pini]
MKTLTTCLLTLTLLALLAVGAHVAQAQPDGSASKSVTVRSSRLARYLGQALSLSRQQQREVQRSTRQYLQQLEALGETPAQPGMVASATEGRLLASPAALQAEKTYEQTLIRVFTPGQYNAYCWLTRQPEAGR